jgi:hypothetical protein
VTDFVPADLKTVLEFVRWSEKTEIGVGRFIPWLGVTAPKAMTGESVTGASTGDARGVARSPILELTTERFAARRVTIQSRPDYTLFYAPHGSASWLIPRILAVDGS